MNKKVNKFHLP